MADITPSRSPSDGALRHLDGAEHRDPETWHDLDEPEPLRV
jgi:hypothetical protein